MPVTTVGSMGDQPIFDKVRRRAAIRESIDDSTEKLQELVREEISTFSDTGNLWKSVKRTDAVRVGTSTWIGTVYSDTEYTAAVEYGWSPRYIDPEQAKALRWGDGTGIQFSKGHYISGFSGHHMFQKATARFDRQYAEDIVERNIRIYTGALDAGRKSIVF